MKTIIDKIRNSKFLNSKMLMFENSKVAKLILASGYKAITLTPFIFDKSSIDDSTMRHENIHRAQFLECFTLGAIVAVPLCIYVSAWFTLLPVLLFYAIYLLNWLITLVYHFFAAEHRPRNCAYRSIMLEQEAYACQDIIGYMQNRKFFAWLRYNSLCSVSKLSDTQC